MPQKNGSGRGNALDRQGRGMWPGSTFRAIGADGRMVVWERVIYRFLEYNFK